MLSSFATIGKKSRQLWKQSIRLYRDVAAFQPRIACRRQSSTKLEENQSFEHQSINLESVLGKVHLHISVFQTFKLRLNFGAGRKRSGGDCWKKLKRNSWYIASRNYKCLLCFERKSHFAWTQHEWSFWLQHYSNCYFGQHSWCKRSRSSKELSPDCLESCKFQSGTLRQNVRTDILKDLEGIVSKRKVNFTPHFIPINFIRKTFHLDIVHVHLRKGLF